MANSWESNQIKNITIMAKKEIKKKVRLDSGKSNRVVVETQTRTVELERGIVQEGTIVNSPMQMRQHVLFVPDNSVPRPELRYRCSGRLQSFEDGTIEFTRSTRKRSQARELVKTDNGRLSLTLDNYYLITIRIPADTLNKVSQIIKDEAMMMAEIMEN